MLQIIFFYDQWNFITSARLPYCNSHTQRGNAFLCYPIRRRWIKSPSIIGLCDANARSCALVAWITHSRYTRLETYTHSSNSRKPTKYVREIYVREEKETRDWQSCRFSSIRAEEILRGDETKKAQIALRLIGRVREMTGFVHGWVHQSAIFTSESSDIASEE